MRKKKNGNVCQGTKFVLFKMNKTKGEKRKGKEKSILSYQRGNQKTTTEEVVVYGVV